VLTVCLWFGAGLAGLWLFRVRALSAFWAYMQTVAELFNFFPTVNDTSRAFSFYGRPFDMTTVSEKHAVSQFAFGIQIDKQFARECRTRDFIAKLTAQNRDSDDGGYFDLRFHRIQIDPARARRQALLVLDRTEKRQIKRIAA
jgi:hypothetical protein